MLTRLKQFIVTRLLGPAVAHLPANARAHLARTSLRKEALESLTGLDREALARLYIRGEGIEVGALNSPLPVPADARVRYVDCVTPEELQRRHQNLEFKPPDIIDDGGILASIPDDSQDFLIACHLIEHMEDPIAAVKNWLRVLKPGGILFLAIPDSRFTFDIHRPVTTWEHLLRDHEDGPAWSRITHLEEVFRKVLGVEDEEEVSRLVVEHGERDTHFHVWTQVEMLDMIVRLRAEVGLDFEVECFASYGNEGTFLLRKGERTGRDLAEQSLRDVRSEFEEVMARRQ